MASCSRLLAWIMKCGSSKHRVSVKIKWICGIRKYNLLSHFFLLNLIWSFYRERFNFIGIQRKYGLRSIKLKVSSSSLVTEKNVVGREDLTNGGQSDSLAEISHRWNWWIFRTYVIVTKKKGIRVQEICQYQMNIFVKAARKRLYQ